MAEPIRVSVKCERCHGSGKDPHLGFGSLGPKGAYGGMSACSSLHGGCGGSGSVIREIVGRDAIVHRFGHSAFRWHSNWKLPFATMEQAQFHADLAALRAFDAQPVGGKDGR